MPRQKSALMVKRFSFLKRETHPRRRKKGKKKRRGTKVPEKKKAEIGLQEEIEIVPPREKEMSRIA